MRSKWDVELGITDKMTRADCAMDQSIEESSEAFWGDFTDRIAELSPKLMCELLTRSSIFSQYEIADMIAENGSPEQIKRIQKWLKQ
jgi:hypothetical protein